jgi:hypothetical protein
MFQLCVDHPDFAARYARMREVADLDPVAVW